MMSNLVFFDLETKKLADEVGGWSNVSQMGLAAAVIYSTADAAYHHFTEERVSELVATLQQADRVVGFNLLRFDYGVLQPYTEVPLHELPTVDMLEHIYRRLGFRLSLDAVATATLGVQKSADGVQAVRWYRQGQVDKLLAYCQRDVELTRDVYEFGRRRGFVHYQDRNYRMQKLPVNW